ncbi:MAG TPA: hypothetical protein DIT89_00790 [Planctomycetaceae bacterium]|nr:hypothetical protein [Planctomycetaceae bacterium]
MIFRWSFIFPPECSQNVLTEHFGSGSPVASVFCSNGELVQTGLIPPPPPPPGPKFRKRAMFFTG